MKRLVYSLIIFSILLFACTISTTATPPAATTATVVTLEAPTATTAPIVTETPTVTPETPTATELPVAQTNVTCNELALFLDPVLASGYDCKTIPEVSGEGFDVNPQYTELTLQGYPLSDRFFTPRIDVFPVQRFSELAPDAVNADVAALQALIGGGAVGNSLPLLPIFNAAQEFHAQYKVLAFANGSGIRYLVQYAQYSAPINNHDMFYSFQGLTGDGKYWISAILPISNSILPANGDNPPNGQTFEQFGNNFPTYIVDITNQLNSQTAGSFIPSLNVLDSLVASIQIQP
jgi:hypothetical protein